MKHDFKVGELVEWSHEGGSSKGAVTQKVTEDLMFRGYVRHASVKDPQYIVKNEGSAQLVMLKGSLLRKVKKTKVQTEAHAAVVHPPARPAVVH